MQLISQSRNTYDELSRASYLRQAHVPQVNERKVNERRLIFPVVYPPGPASRTTVTIKWKKRMTTSRIQAWYQNPKNT